MVILDFSACFKTNFKFQKCEYSFCEIITQTFSYIMLKKIMSKITIMSKIIIENSISNKQTRTRIQAHKSNDNNISNIKG